MEAVKSDQLRSDRKWEDRTSSDTELEKKCHKATRDNQKNRRGDPQGRFSFSKYEVQIGPQTPKTEGTLELKWNFNRQSLN